MEIFETVFVRNNLIVAFALVGVTIWFSYWLADKLTQAGCEFVIEPGIRFEGLPGEQATFFLFDPARNALEFKAFRDIDQLFAT